MMAYTYNQHCNSKICKIHRRKFLLLERHLTTSSLKKSAQHQNVARTVTPALCGVLTVTIALCGVLTVTIALCGVLTVNIALCGVLTVTIALCVVLTVAIVLKW